MLRKKKVNTFILYSVNYIVDKLNDSHYGRLWPGKEDRREKDTFRLVMCFKHAAITVTTKKAQHANTRSLPTVRPLRSAPGDTFGTRTSRFLEGKWQHTWGSVFLQGMIGRDHKFTSPGLVKSIQEGKGSSSSC